ncbi:WD repeat-containing protein [Sulfurimonas gotlandica GD1]|uniref:WD repeat-containing protein n=1 Tax=Sulfurimonas gotlandica (strain DSM 19862 / JCM 16533 / GD1) TaxID=929558 RepID=B6BKZ0_SULGG|nr:caspase family protein [Sulfurimonas gotlandica]EDZ62433.1 caspase domain protein [Sulfurimonas gotlandica GD1]EHP29204.1 WD repeat-containing protein [Sulfurimonas gotlandica GD1]
MKKSIFGISILMAVLVLMNGCGEPKPKPTYTYNSPIIEYTDENFKITHPTVDTPHSGLITALAITLDDKFAITGSEDSSIKIINIKTGQTIKTLLGHSKGVTDIAITHDGKRLISSSKNAELIVWDIASGKIIKKTKSSWSGSTVGIKILKKTNAVLSVHRKTFSSEVTLSDINTGNVTKRINLKFKVTSFDVTKDENFIICTDDPFGAIKMVDIKTGKIIKSFSSQYKISSNRNLVTLGKGADLVKILPDNKHFISTGGHMQEYSVIWNIDSAKPLKILGKTDPKSIAISRDGSKVFMGGYKFLEIWDIEKGGRIKRYDYPLATVSPIKLTNNEKHVISSEFTAINKLNIKTNKFNDIYESKINRIIHSSVTPNGQSIIYSSKSAEKHILNGLKQLDFKTGRLIREFEGAVKGFVISKDSKYLVAIGYDNIIRIWGLETGQIIKEIAGHFSKISALDISLDNKYLVSGSSDGTLKLWDLVKGREVKSFSKKLQDSPTIRSVKITNNKIIVGSSRTLSGYGSLEIWDINKNKLLKRYDNEYTEKLYLAPSGNFLFADTGYLDLKTNELDNDKFRRKLYDLTAMAITFDGKFIFYGQSSGKIKLLNINTKKVIREYSGHTGKITSLSLSPNKKYLVSSGDDGTIKYWDIKTGKELLTTASFTDGEWLSITPDGYFDASKNGAKYLNLQTAPMEVSSIDQYYETFYRPDIVASAMSEDKNIQYATPAPTLKLSDVKPAPEVAIIDTKGSIDKEELKVTLKITPSSGGIGQIRLYLDGVLIKTDGDRGLQKKQDKNAVLKTYTIKLPKGEHTLKAIVYNEENTMASKEDILAVVSTFNPIVKPNIYAVVVGINEYKNPSISLKYAVADAELFAQTIKDKTKGLYGDVKVELLISKEQTSKENITKTLKALETISPNDLFIFFVASHGMVEDAKYHMITSNVGALSTRGIEKEAISQNALRDLLANIPTTKKFIVLDTCNSGALGQTLEVALLTRGLTETTAMKVLSRAVGSTIISASSSSQEALEGYKGHGLLTYVLTDGLNGKADGDSDGYIKTLEIANFVEDTVPQIAEKEFKRAQYPFVSPLGHGFPLVKVK